MKSSELKRWLEKQGCTFVPARGGHMKVFLGERMTVLPMHGANKEVGKGLYERILRDLKLKGGSDA